VYDQSRLIELIHEKALEFGDFTLASGKKASFYLDCRRLTLDGESANLVAEGILEKIREELPDAVGGMAIGADPITASVITLAWQQGHSLRGFIVRKEMKGYGMGRQIEGPVKQGDRVVILEDVITTGGSSLTAIAHAREFGLTVDRLITIVDRGENSRQVFADVGVEFESLVHVNDLKIATDI
jgi:orotate phosphoribosyltransferase